MAQLLVVVEVDDLAGDEQERAADPDHQLGDDVHVPRYESDGYLHLWQVTAHMLGVKDEYIPASWDEANAQAAQVLDPILASTPEGVVLSDILLDIAQLDLDGNDRSALRPAWHAMTRYMCGEAVAEMLEIPREPFWDPTVRVAWPTYVALREGALLVPLAPTVSWTFDEILRSGVIFYLGAGDNIHIEMPTANRTSF